MSSNIEALPDVLVEARSKSGLSHADLAARMGVSRTTAINRESGRRDFPASDLVDLARATGCTIVAGPTGWRIGEPSTQPLPFYGRIPCGRPVPVGDEPTQALDLGDLAMGDWHPQDGFVIQASGDSMDPVIADGDWLICRRQQTWRLWDIVLVFVDDWTTVKQVRPHPDPRRGQCLAPVNESHGRMLDVEGADVRMYGLVLGRLFYQPLGR